MVVCAQYAWPALLLLLAAANGQFPCADLRSAAVAGRASHANLTVGLSDSSEVLVFNGGDIIGDLYVTANATVLLQAGTTSPTAPIVIQGNIYLFDNAIFTVATGTQVSIAQTSPSEHSFQLFDNSNLDFQQAVVDLGVNVNMLQTWYVCQNSQASVNGTDFSQRTKGSVTAFIYDSATFRVSGVIGDGLEVSLAQKASLIAASNPAPFGLNIYFVVNETMPTFQNWRLGGVVALNQRMTSATGALNVSLMVSGTQTSLGVWLLPGADVVLNNTQALLFPSWGAATTFYLPPADIQPCNTLKIGHPCQKYEDRTFKLGSGATGISVHFLNSEVYLWNVYFDGAGAATMHSLVRSVVGETNCRNQANCTYKEVTVDGTGGYCLVEHNAVATYTSGAIVTYTFVRDHSVAVFDSSLFTYNGRLPEIRLQVDGGSTVKLINTGLPTAVSTNNATVNVYDLKVSTDSLFLRATVLPVPNLLVDDPNCSVIVPPDVEMEVLPLTAPRSFVLEVLDDTQTVLATRSIAPGAAPEFFRGHLAWGGASPLAIPTYNGVHILQISTISGNVSAVARSYINVTGCKNKGCPYDLLGAILDNCFLEDFLDTKGATCLTPCKTASINLGRGWFNMDAANRSACVLNYPDTVGARPLPFGLNISYAATRLSSGRDLCAAVSGALQAGGGVLGVVAILLAGLFF